MIHGLRDIDRLPLLADAIGLLPYLVAAAVLAWVGSEIATRVLLNETLLLMVGIG